MPEILQDLRSQAQGLLAGERRRVTIQPTMLVNEAYIKLKKSGHVTSDVDAAHAKALLVRALRQVLGDYVRKRKGATGPEGQDRVLLDIDFNDPVAPIHHVVDALALEEALQLLDDKRRQVFELRYWGGMTYQEIADEVGCSESNVRVLLPRARQQLMEYFAEKGASEENDG